MRSSSFVLLVALFPVAVFAQAKTHCSVQPARALTDADAAYMAGDAATAESLWSAKLSPTPSTAAYAGVIRSEIQENKLDEALATSKTLDRGVSERRRVLHRGGGCADSPGPYSGSVPGLFQGSQRRPVFAARAPWVGSR